MLEAETRAATPTGIVGDRRDETIGGGFKTGNYRLAALPTIPSPEDTGRLVRVVPHAGRLYAVAPFREAWS